MTSDSHGQLPWKHRMRRVTENTARPIEWMAPDDVVRRVRQNYLEAVEWLNHVERDTRAGSHFISGTMMEHLAGQIWTRGNPPMFVGVLRSDHHIHVRRFSEDGERCLVVDQQTQRRMATYHTTTGQRAATQDLGDATVVYSMIYDAGDGRWKIDAFVQELPLGWERRRSAKAITEVNHLSPRDASGRDS